MFRLLFGSLHQVIHIHTWTPEPWA